MSSVNSHCKVKTMVKGEWYHACLSHAGCSASTTCTLSMANYSSHSVEYCFSLSTLLQVDTCHVGNGRFHRNDKRLIDTESYSPLSSSTEAHDDFRAMQTERMRSRMQLLPRVLMTRTRRRTYTMLNLAVNLTGLGKMWGKI